MRVPLNLENYPSLMKLAKSDKETFISLMQGLLKIADQAAQDGHLEASKKYFNLPYEQVAAEILNGFFDTKGILENHGESHVQYLYKIYEHELHPLHKALTDEKLEDRDGNVIPFHEKYGISQRDFTIKRWIQGLLFWSYYCSLRDYAKALSLNNLVMAEEEKKRYFLRLLPIQPALQYQKEHDRPVGSMIPETGLFDTGVHAANVTQICLACKKKGTIYETNVAKGCQYCGAGYPKNSRPYGG